MQTKYVIFIKANQVFHIIIKHALIEQNVQCIYLFFDELATEVIIRLLGYGRVSIHSCFRTYFNSTYNNVSFVLLVLMSQIVLALGLMCLILLALVKLMFSIILALLFTILLDIMIIFVLVYNVMG